MGGWEMRKEGGWGATGREAEGRPGGHKDKHPPPRGKAEEKRGQGSQGGLSGAEPWGLPGDLTLPIRGTL